MNKYKLVCKKGEGTFSEVVSGINTENGKEYAIKCMKSKFDSLQKVNNLREIQALKRLTPHPHIVNLEEVLYDQPSGRLAMVFELMDANLYDLISGRRDHLDSEHVRSLGYQLFLALQYMHSKGIFHRDIKPENVLVDASGKHLKVADLGSCRSIYARAPMTEYIATRWYRSPECLLTDGHYGAEMDIWGAGCVIFEITALFPLFPGADEVDQINRIHKVIGTPKESVLNKLREKGSSKINYNFHETKGVGLKHFIPHASSDCINLLEKTMIYDYEERIDATAAVNHKYFSKLRKHDDSIKEEPPILLKESKEKEAKPVDGITSKSKRCDPIRHSRSNHPGGKQALARQKIKLRSLKKTHEEPNLMPEKSLKQNRKIVKPNILLKQPRSHIPANKLESTTGHDQEHNTKTTAKRSSKYSNVQSSGYGKSTYNPFQSKDSNLKIRETNRKSGGTHTTAKSSLPSIEPKPRYRRSTDLPIEKNRQKERQSNLPPIKV